MISYTEGNLLDAPVEALVNTVNTVGVMGKGIALMFKDKYSLNMSAYTKACKAKQVVTGKMFVTETSELLGPKWIVNFPTKRHWRHPSKMEWIVAGLEDLKRFIIEQQVKSIAIPPLGAGNGGLPWPAVRAQIEQALGDLEGVNLLVYQPTEKYQNVAKPQGVEKLTPARALIAELVRRYWIMGIECSLMEIQKLAWFLERTLEAQEQKNPLKLQFEAHHYGPYADRLRHLLNGLDGSYLQCDKRLGDAAPLDVIWFNDGRRQQVSTYLMTEAKEWLPALEKTTALIDGFESPFGLELLATVDWLVQREGVEPDVPSVMDAITQWPAGPSWADRKVRLFNERTIGIALTRLSAVDLAAR